MTWLRYLPTLNATLNGISAVFLVTGFIFIRLKKISIHRFFMVSALCTSTLFLASYLTYHAFVGSVHFPGHGRARIFYLVLLFSHTLLAGLVLPMALITVTYAFKKRFEKHKKLARWTFPIWLYVSITGVIVYWVLYVVYKAPIPIK